MDNRILMNNRVAVSTLCEKTKLIPALSLGMPPLKSVRAGKGIGFCILCLALCAILLVPLRFSLAASGAALDEAALTEYEVKALYVYYFAKFVEWPADTFSAKDSPIVIGIIGDEAFGSRLTDIVKNKTVQDHPITIRMLKWPADPRACHLLYIGSSEQKRFLQIAETLQRQPVLTVTEAEESFPAKGIMNLFMAGGKVQFEVDLVRAGKAHLQISSKLLRLARGITGNNLGKGE
jgi:hypothetical protein